MMSLLRYYVVVPPGFEEVAMAECRRQLPDANLQPAEKGGFEVHGDIELGLRLNQLLRIPTRVLLRLYAGPCKTFEELRGVIASVPWTDYFTEIQPVWKVSSHQSRLYHRERIEDVAARALRAFFRQQQGRELPRNLWYEKPAEVHLRFDHDHLDISIDTSGEELFKRGVKTLKSRAPLRENLASALLQTALSQLEWPTQFQLFDPMCGTGTFLLEALLLNTPLERGVALEKFPIWKARTATKGAASTSSGITAVSAPQQVAGWDRDAHMMKQVKQDIRALGLGQVALTAQDLFEPFKELPWSKEASAGAASPSKILLTNPPYGPRLALPLPKRVFWPRLYERLQEFQPDLFGFIMPRDAVSQLPTPSAYVDFKNGALAVRFLMFKGVGG